MAVLCYCNAVCFFCAQIFPVHYLGLVEQDEGAAPDRLEAVGARRFRQDIVEHNLDKNKWREKPIVIIN